MSNANRFPYRPDIDGLRAIAVLSVVFHHLNKTLVPGGFIGVDIFFVISGFVVTQSILRTQTGNALTDLLVFWRRRWLRIVPALLVMIVLTSIAFAAFYPPVPFDNYIATLRTGLTSAFGLSNMYLLAISSDYFQSDQGINVFLHTWSLGVEEQFYVIFSVFFISLPTMFFPHRVMKTARTCLLGLGFALSLWLFLTLADDHPAAAFYLLPTRFWEMAMGSIIALWLAEFRSGQHLSEHIPRPLLEIIQFTALEAMGVSRLVIAACAMGQTFPIRYLMNVFQNGKKIAL